MIALATFPVLTHSDATIQYKELGIQLDHSDLAQIRVRFNLYKICAAIPRGDKAIRVMLPGQPLRIELGLQDFQNALTRMGIPSIVVPVPFSEIVAKYVTEKDDLSEFMPTEESEELARMEEQIRNGEVVETEPSPAKIVPMLVNALNIVHFGSTLPNFSNIQVIGLPSILPIAMSSDDVEMAIADALYAVDGKLNQPQRLPYDACPDGWGSV